MEGPSRETPIAEVLADAAERIAALVGDGCVIRARDPETGELLVVTEHREPGRLDGLRKMLMRTSLEPRGWLAQALERGSSLSVPGLCGKLFDELGIPRDERVGETVVIPIQAAEAVVVVMRDKLLGPYTAAQRRTIEAITARAGAFLAELGLKQRSGAGEPPVTTGFEHLLDVTSAALWMVDANGITTYVNEAASELAGWPADELVGVPVAEFIGGPPNRGRLGFTGSEACERPLVRSDGSTVWVTTTARPQFGDDGAHVATLYTLVDVDERRRREIGLRLCLSRESALRRLAERLAAVDGVEDAFPLVASAIADELGMEHVAVAKIDENASHARALAAVGWNDRGREWLAAGSPGWPIPPGSAADIAIRTGRSLVVDDYRREGGYRRHPALVEAGIRSGVILPLEGGEIALSAHSPRAHAVDEEGLELLAGIARLISPERPAGGDPAPLRRPTPA